MQCKGEKTRVFSSPELKVQVSFSDRLLSVVRPSIYPSACKLLQGEICVYSNKGRKGEGEIIAKEQRYTEMYLLQN
jgi:hypothetical protein